MDKKISSIFASSAPWKITLVSVVGAVIITDLVTVVISIMIWREIQAVLLILGTLNATLAPVLLMPFVIRMVRRTINLEEKNRIHEGTILQLESRKQIDAAAQRRADELALLYQLGISLASGKDLNSTLLALQTEIARLMKVDAFFVAIYNREADIVSYPLFIEAGQPTQQADRSLHEYPGFTGAVILNNRTLYLPDMMTEDVDEQYHPYDTSGPILHTFLGIPLVVNKQVIGALSVQSREINAYTSDQVQLMEALAVQAAIAIDKASLLDQLQKELAERERTEQALRYSEGKFSKAFHTTPVMMSIEADGRFIDVNNAFVENIGYPREEVIGRSARELHMWASPEDQVKIATILREKGDFKDVEVRFQSRSGETGYVLMSSENFEVDNKNYSLTSALNITERKHAEAEREKLIERLETTNQELERFTYTVSHDLKAPLVTIRGFLGYLREDAIKGNIERLENDMQRITNATDRMKTLLEDLLELSRIGRMMNPPENVAFADLVNDALDLVRGRLDAGRVRVTVQPDLPTVNGDRQRLTEVLQNLIDNAAKFMGSQSDPQLKIGQRGMEEGKPVFFVQDNGIGIAPEYHERIFGLFNKLDPHIEGTGVGLALVKRIVEVHGGKIWVESNGQGTGSSFYFTLSMPKAA